MKIANHYTFAAPRQRIWSLIYNPATLVSLIPGCDHLEQISPTEYRGQIQLRLPAVAGAFQTYVRLMEYDEPNYCQFAGEVSGSPGSLKGIASFWLEANGEQTHMDYQGQAIISGALSHLNDRLIEGVAQTLIKQGLHKLNEQAQTPSQPSP